uniref:Metalloendopeptidase n=1 Tax=Steinernema glaseri TaxID=37863 RepID=A0A1I7YKD3_9BILA
MQAPVIYGLLLLWTVHGQDCPTLNGISPATRQAIVDKHNAYRSSNALGNEVDGSNGGYAPTASNMYKLSYDCTLEGMAQAWADKCVFQHSPQNRSAGENIYYSSPTVQDDGPVFNAIDSWWNELKKIGVSAYSPDLTFTYDLSLKKVGHYTQMAWANTTTVGCGHAKCTNMNFVVCNYRRTSVYPTAISPRTFGARTVFFLGRHVKSSDNARSHRVLEKVRPTEHGIELLSVTNMNTFTKTFDRIKKKRPCLRSQFALEMRLLPTLFVLFASVLSLSFAEERPEAPLRGKELFKKLLRDQNLHTHPIYAEIDEVAKLIAEHRAKHGYKVKKQDSRFKEIYAAKVSKNIEEVNSALEFDEFLVEGDILLSLDDAKRHFGVHDNSAPVVHRAKRENATLRIKEGIEFWEKYTCLRFQEVDPLNSPSYPVMTFYDGGGCHTQIGRDPPSKEHLISIGSGCEVIRTTTHEIAHALGFIHEQCRWDRDQYIRVDEQNVHNGTENNYYKYKEEENDNYGKQYDYGSVMHYPFNGLAIDSSKPVIYTNNPGYKYSIGYSPYPLYGDIYEMNMLYSCYDKCQAYGTVCQNEGKPDPNNCRICQCPAGFGGDDCSQIEPPSPGLPRDCGGTLQATDSWQTVKVEKMVGNGEYKIMDVTQAVQCSWHITAPVGKKIQFIVEYVGFNYRGISYLCDKACVRGALVVKGIEKTWIPEGMRFCCEEQFNQQMTTSSNRLVLRAYNSMMYTDFTVKYKIESGSGPGPTEPTQSTSTTTRRTSSTSTTRRPTQPTTKTSGVESYGNDFFTAVITKMNFNEAESYCQSIGGHLFSSHDSATEKYYHYAINYYSPNGDHTFWIGLHKPRGANSQYSWTDGSPLDYKNWANGSPRPSQNEECTAYQGPNWATQQCTEKHPFVCNKVQ